MFPNYYKKNVIKLIHLLSDDPENYYTTLANSKKIDTLIKKLISLIEDTKIGKDD